MPRASRSRRQSECQGPGGCMEVRAQIADPKCCPAGIKTVTEAIRKAVRATRTCSRRTWAPPASARWVGWCAGPQCLRQARHRQPRSLTCKLNTIICQASAPKQLAEGGGSGAAPMRKRGRAAPADLHSLQLIGALPGSAAATQPLRRAHGSSMQQADMLQGHRGCAEVAGDAHARRDTHARLKWPPDFCAPLAPADIVLHHSGAIQRAAKVRGSCMHLCKRCVATRCMCLAAPASAGCTRTLQRAKATPCPQPCRSGWSATAPTATRPRPSC